MNLETYWLEFETSNPFSLPPGIAIGCGVTAYNYDDAVRIVYSKIFKAVNDPPLKKVIKGMKINQLDQGHVVPNMKPMKFYGIWFPIGYD